MDRIEKAVSQVTLWACGAVLLVMMAQIALDVGARQGLGTGLPATADIVARYYMVVLALLPMCFAEVRNRHIAVTVFTRGLRQPALTGVQKLGQGVSALVYGLVAYASMVEAMRQTTKGAYIEAGLTRLTTWPSYWLPPIAFACVAALCLLRLFDRRSRDADG